MDGQENKNETVSRKFIISAVALIFILGFTYFVSGFVFGGREESRGPAVESSSPLNSPNAANPIPTEDETGEEVVCPVCKVAVDPDKAEYSHVHKKSGVTYYFDREKCYLEFLDRPHLYLKGKPTLKIKIKISPGGTETPDNTVIEDLPSPSPDGNGSPSPDSTDSGRIRIEDVPLSTTPTPEIVRTPPAENKRPRKSLPPPGKIPYNPPPTFDPPPAMPVPDSGGTMPEAAPLPGSNPPSSHTPPGNGGGETIKAPPASPVPDGKGNADDFEIPAGATPPRREKK